MMVNVGLERLSKNQGVNTSQALYSFIDSKHYVTYIHKQVAGRVRLKVRGLYESKSFKDNLTNRLSRFSFIDEVRANIQTSRLLIVFDRKKQHQDLLELVDSVIKKIVFEEMTGEKAELFGGFGIPKQQQEVLWHSLSKNELEDACQTSIKDGLSDRQVEEKSLSYGKNELSHVVSESSTKVFLRQFCNLPVGVLLGSAMASALLGSIGDAALISAVVFANGYIAYITEKKAEKIIRSLNEKSQEPVKVLRNGKTIEIVPEDLVIGDVVFLTQGEVPADIRLLKVDHLKVDEAVLTGESYPVGKEKRILDFAVPLAKRSNMVYKGTVVTSGSGVGIVVGVGLHSELGMIQLLTQKSQTPETIYQKNLRKLGDEILVLCVVVCLIVLLLGLARGFKFIEIVKSAVSLAIAAVPEGLTTVGTTVLAIGVTKLRKNNVLVRTLHGVEALGSIQTFCFDKTGTLTLNEMQVRKVNLEFKDFNFADGSKKLDQLQNYRSWDLLIKTLILCNDSQVVFDGKNASIKGSPTENALIQLTLQAGYDPKVIRSRFPRTKAKYRSEHKQFMRTIHIQDDGKPDFEALKGNPLQVLRLCDHWQQGDEQLPLSSEKRESLINANKTLARAALRVLGFAYRERKTGSYTWLGLVGLQDSPRHGVKDLIAKFHRAGIDTVMLTGDQSQTAKAVGKELNLSGKENLLVAEENWFEKLKNNDRPAQIHKKYHIFPRVSPSTKLGIVEELQASGSIVGMTGDGINDAPALRASNVGIAMGGVGTSVAKESADMILLDDNLATIYDAIMLGRTIRKNLRKSIHFLFATNLSEIFLMLGAIGMGWGIPLNPMQLLWINLVTDIFPSLALAMEAPDQDIMNTAPENPENPFFNAKDKRKIVADSLVITASTLFAYRFWISGRKGLDYAGTGAFLSLTISQLIYALSLHNNGRHNSSKVRQQGNPYLLGAISLCLLLLLSSMKVPFLKKLLSNRPLSITDQGLAILTAVLPNVLIGIRERSVSKPSFERETQHVMMPS
ncbi:MAG: HAD-IC family P-type ATPase [Oligoflexales bacterium]